MPIITRTITKRYLQITSTAYDTLIDQLIPQVEHDFINIRNKEFDEDSNDIVDYPDGSELIVAQMIGYKMSMFANRGAGSGMQSESIGDYSYSRRSSKEFLKGYPREIVSGIERFVKLR